MYDESVYSGNVLEFVDNVLKRAVDLRAADIHFDFAKSTTESWMAVRLRVDGILRDIARLDRSTLDPQSVANSIKVSSNIDVSHKKKAHDSRFSYKVGDIDLDVRVATVPTFAGEKIAMRLIDKRNYLLPFEKLGMAEQTLKTYQALIQAPQGFIVIVGPTGCGKTTTLYSTLKQVDSRDKNIVTLEDPVECNFPGINQIQVDPEFGMSFVSSLRAVLRLDPDVVMIGEIRDAETARIAFHAALAGTLMLSTLHAKNAVSTISRLLEMEVEPFLIASGLTGIVSQRLVRLTCTTCRGSGCKVCFNSGFKGRVGIYELVKVSKGIRDLILARANEDEIQAVALRDGMVTFEASGQELIKRGLTTEVEVRRVVSSEFGA